MNYTDADLLSIDLYADDKDDGGVRLAASGVVHTRKVQTCVFLGHHEIPVGARARVETGLMDNKWYSFYVCGDCLVEVLEEFDAP